MADNPLTKILRLPEGRRLEFKESPPAGSALAKIVIAFSNDAGGELYIGIKDHPRKIIGIPDEELFATEEKISNIIFDSCYPTIVPDISFVNLEGKTLIKVKVYRGNQVPYYLKSEGKNKGTYIRVGSSNRLASEEMIQELERLKRNISFDSLPNADIELSRLELSEFKAKFFDRTKKKIDQNGLRKLELIKPLNNNYYPTNAAILLSNSDFKKEFFPYAKIECARFKGKSVGDFLDQKTIAASIVQQPDEAMHFVQRNIAKSSFMNGIYREDRWEYPLEAVREAIINAVIHRDYSLLGKDIKVAIFDNKLEITSPGTLPSSIDLTELPIGQSEIRNRVLAPIFKDLGLIEQWGTGFKKIKEALNEYPEIGLDFSEPGLAFKIQFLKKNFEEDEELEYVPNRVSDVIAPSKYSAATQQVPSKYPASTQQARVVLSFCQEARTRDTIQKRLKLKDREHFRSRILKPLLDYGLLKMLYPDKPNSPKQEYLITTKGKKYLSDFLEDEY